MYRTSLIVQQICVNWIPVESPQILLCGAVLRASTTASNRTVIEQKQNGRGTEAELMQNRKHLPICENGISVESPRILSRGPVLWIIWRGIHNSMK